MAGYFDLQVNGFAGADFNSDALSEDQMHAACEALRADGVEAILATVITDDIARMQARLGRIVALREGDDLVRSVIAGIHIEGPFLNPEPGFIGAHPAAHARPADVDLMNRLLDAAGGLTRIVTLAPECDPDLRVTRMLADRGVVVAGGHSDVSHDLLRAAVDAGLSMYTHLGNGCPLHLARHDNIIQRVLSVSDRIWVTLIADGAHLPMFVLKNFLRTIGFERAIVISDAIAAAGLGPGVFTLGERELHIGDDLVARTPEGYLAGSAMSLSRAARNLREGLGVTEAQLHALLVDNPRRAARPEP